MNRSGASGVERMRRGELWAAGVGARMGDAADEAIVGEARTDSAEAADGMKAAIVVCGGEEGRMVQYP